eukprot:5493146-Heterocapsa_arctica.AAC.1
MSPAGDWNERVTSCFGGLLLAQSPCSSRGRSTLGFEISGIATHNLKPRAAVFGQQSGCVARSTTWRATWAGRAMAHAM